MWLNSVARAEHGADRTVEAAWVLIQTCHKFDLRSYSTQSAEVSSVGSLRTAYMYSKTKAYTCIAFVLLLRFGSVLVVLLRIELLFGCNVLIQASHCGQ